jgi:hypothetical protein
MLCSEKYKPMDKRFQLLVFPLFASVATGVLLVESPLDD